VAIGGHAPVLIDLINIIVYGQIWSIVLSGILVFFITSVMFWSPIAGLFCAAPITLATAFNFATMAVLGIKLEPATAVTACIGIGVGVDYGIHFIAKYQIMRQRGDTGRALVESTMASAGKAIFFNASIVIGGFLVLLTSQFPPSRHMGFMVGLNMFTSYVAAVTVLPAMLAWLKPRFCEPKEAAAQEAEAA
jgi:predicted RND superfamily exporter protein